MTIAYRETDPISSRWTGLGRLLTAYEVDYNFYQLDNRLTTVEASLTTTISIASVSSDGSALTIHLTDSSTQGPFIMPTAAFRDRGTWLTSTAYLVNDTFSFNGTLYRVLFAHTSSATSFSPTANDGAGHDYYAAMITTPGSALPSGGATAQVLQKSSSTDYAVTWGYKLPTGGTQYQVLMKNSSTNQDASWQGIGGTHVSFHGSTASGLTSATVSDAVEEVEHNLQLLAATVSGLSSTLTLADLTDVLFGTGDPSTGSILYYSGGKWRASTAPSANNTLVWNGSAWVPQAPTLADSIEFVIDGGGATITTGLKGYIEVPYNCTITGVKQFGDQSGSIVTNIWKCSYANFDAGATHPVAADKITASAPPTISSNTKSSDATLTGWTTSLSAGDILAYNVDSVTSLQRVTISLKVTR